MHFHQKTAEIFIPDGLPAEEGLKRTTHLAISAHQDDIEIMAAGAILECYQRKDQWFSGVVMTDGRGSPRAGIYKDFTDEEMHERRIEEQKKAAMIGEYAAQVMLDYPSRELKDKLNVQPVEDLEQVIKIARPRYVYVHNLADKHDTHVAAALKAIAAIRRLTEEERPEKLYGCEVWRDLDWMVDSDKAAFDLSRNQSLQVALLEVFDSQVTGGKRYDLATMGRRQANATYYESHGVDQTTGLSFAMDLSPLIISPEKEIIPFVQEHIQRFADDVANRLTRLG